MDLNDQKLDQLLKDVGIPDDLKASLHQIAESESNRSETLSPNVDLAELDEAKSRPIWLQTATKVAAWGGGTILAASLALVLVWLNWPRPSGPISRPNPDVETNNKKEEIEVQLQEQLIAEMKVNQQKIEQVLHQLKLQEKRIQLARLQRPVVEAIVAEDEKMAIGLALGGQAALEKGALLENVQAQWKNVIQDYPDSAGAELANEFLNKSKSN